MMNRKVSRAMMNSKKSTSTKSMILTFIIGLALAIIIRQFLFFNVIVPTLSMYPTIKINDNIITTKIYNSNNLKRGDIIAFNSKELNVLLVKRLIGLPGDSIIIKDGQVYINGTKIKETYVKEEGGKDGSYIVPKLNYFFLGDNRNNSMDSRYWKNPYIKYEDLKGKAVFRISPIYRMGFIR